jgi:hypothetical protein
MRPTKVTVQKLCSFKLRIFDWFGTTDSIHVKLIGTNDGLTKITAMLIERDE